MSNSSRRTSPLPPDWPKIRISVLERDNYRCQYGHSGIDGEFVNPRDGWCCNIANEVDHIGSPRDHSPERLRSLCTPHHRMRTAQQANAARWAKAGTKERPKPKHPGVIDG